jgi:indolepyruvate ferredoxin oxidoreductase
LSLQAIEEAIRLNGAAVDLNLAAFRLGRIAAIDPAAPASWISDGASAAIGEVSLEALVDERAAILEAFDGAALAMRYRELVTRVSGHEARLGGESGQLGLAVARGFFKALYYKDEYEVARLFSDGTLQRRLAEAFDGDLKIRFNLAPPAFSRRGADGREAKREFGPWVLVAFRYLARAKRLRGTVFDVFGKSEHRRIERELGREYEALVDSLLPLATVDNLGEVARLAEAYEGVKGFGVVKEAKLAEVRRQVAEGIAALGKD